MKRPWYICRGALFSHLCPQAMLYTMWGSYVCSKNSWLACTHGTRRQAYPGKAFGQCSRIRLNFAATWEKDFVPPVSWCSRSPESPGFSWYSPGALLVVCWCSCWSPHVLLVGLWQSHVVSWLSFLGSPCVVVVVVAVLVVVLMVAVDACSIPPIISFTCVFASGPARRCHRSSKFLIARDLGRAHAVPGVSLLHECSAFHAFQTKLDYMMRRWGRILS